MSESATEFQTRDDWEDALAQSDDLPDLAAADEVTDEADTEPAEPEAEEAAESEAPETDAEAQPEIEVEAEADAAVEDDEHKGPEAPDAPSAKAEAKPAPTDGDLPAPEQTESTPFVAKADGIEIALDGAVLAGNEVRIPLDTFRRQLQPHLADRATLQSRYDRMKTDYERQLSARSESEAKAEQAFENLASILDKGPDAVWQWLQDFDSNKAALIAEAEKSGLAAKLSTYEQRDEVQRKQDANRNFEDYAPKALYGAIDSFLEQPDFKDLGIDRADLYEQIAKFGAARVFLTADRDIPEWGVKKGQTTIDWDFVGRHVQGTASTARKIREQAAAEKAELKRVYEAEQANIRRLAGKQIVPPAVPAGGTPSPGSKQVLPKSRDEWEADLAELTVD